MNFLKHLKLYIGLYAQQVIGCNVEILCQGNNIGNGRLASAFFPKVYAIVACTDGKGKLLLRNAVLCS